MRNLSEQPRLFGIIRDKTPKIRPSMHRNNKRTEGSASIDDVPHGVAQSPPINWGRGPAWLESQAGEPVQCAPNFTVAVTPKVRGSRVPAAAKPKVGSVRPAT